MRRTKMGWIIIVSLLLQLFPNINIFTAGATRYVATAGNDSNDCTSTSTPCATINAAIGKAGSGDTILVAEGTYKGSITNINKSLTLSGGWNATFSAHPSMTTANGENIRQCMNIASNVTVVIEQFFFLNCGSVYATGGGIYSQGYLTVKNSSFKNNKADYGAGIFNYGTLSIENVTFSDNFAQGAGGAIENHNTDQRAYIRNATITGNKARDGGGLFGGFLIENTILSGNSNTGGWGTDCTDNGEYIISNGYNLMGSLAHCNFTASSSDQIGIDPLLGAYNQIWGFYPLQGASPAIDAGNPTNCPSTDQRGSVRPLDGNQDGIARCDIGAIEYPSYIGPASIISIYNGDAQRTPLDFDFHIPFIVLVTDNYGNPINGNEVTFSAPASGPSGIFSATASNQASVITDGTGLARSPVFIANNISGNYNINASANGISSSVNFNESNAPLWYVAPAGTGKNTNACNTIGAPCATVQGVIAKPGFVAGDGIRMAEGIYAPISPSKDVSISGGWNPTFETQEGYSTIDGGKTNNPVYITNLHVTIEKMIIENGFASYEGGGIYTDYSELWLDKSIIRNNSAGLSSPTSAYGTGGGMAIYDSKVSISDSTFVFNTSGVYGGAIFIDRNSELTLNNTTIVGNSVPEATIGNNLAFGVNGSSSLTIGNSILSDCFRGYPPDDYQGTINSKGNNIFGNKSSCFAPSDTVQSSDRFQIDPSVVVFMNYGISGFIPGSPAVDMGNPATCSPTDEVGNARPVDGNLDGSAICDIGAYEMNGNGTLPEYVYTYPKTTYLVDTKNLHPSAFRAVVWDSLGRGVPGVNVTFTAPATGVSGIFIGTGTNSKTVLTNSLGIASINDYIATSSSGTYTILVSAEGTSETDTISVINGDLAYIYLPAIFK